MESARRFLRLASRNATESCESVKLFLALRSILLAVRLATRAFQAMSHWAVGQVAYAGKHVDGLAIDRQHGRWNVPTDVSGVSREESVSAHAGPALGAESLYEWRVNRPESW